MTINLCFHGIGVCPAEREPGGARYWVPRDVFLRILDEARERADVRISFDDGNASDIQIALPALAERGLHATFFALAGRLDEPASLAPSDLRELRAAGMGIGSHGWSHIPWRGLTVGDQKRELVDARAALSEASGGPIHEAALPLGRYDRNALRRLRALNYRVIFSSDRFPARSSAWLQPRYSVTAGDTVATVHGIMSHRVGVRDLRNLAASSVKRLR